jgi:uncharacterized membrane protein
MIEALMLSAIGLLQGYILTRIDALDSRIDSLGGKLQAIEWHCKWLMQRSRSRSTDLVNPKTTGNDRD